MMLDYENKTGSYQPVRQLEEISQFSEEISQFSEEISKFSMQICTQQTRLLAVVTTVATASSTKCILKKKFEQRQQKLRFG